MATATKTVYWTIVTYGPCQLPSVIDTDRQTVADARQAAINEMVSDGGGPASWADAHSWVRGYATREQAAAADCSDDIGKRGRVA